MFLFPKVFLTNTDSVLATQLFLCLLKYSAAFITDNHLELYILNAQEEIEFGP